MPRAVYQHPLMQRAKETIERELGLAPKEPILVALSGGADSVALLRAMLFMGFPVAVAHCNFHLRGDESNRDEAFVVDLCRHFDLKLRKADFDTNAYAAQNGISVEVAARDLRYQFFDVCLDKQGYSFVAVAHHLEDNIETFFGNLANGCGIKGLKAIPPKRDRIVRPLIDVPHEDIISFLQLIDQPYCTDSSNSDTSIRRNYIRHNIRPLFNRLNPSFPQAMAHTIANLRESDRLLDWALTEQLQRTALSTEGSVYNARAIAASPAPVSLLFALLSPLGFTRIRIVPFAEQLLNPEPATIESATHKVVRRGGKLYISSITPKEIK